MNDVVFPISSVFRDVVVKASAHLSDMHMPASYGYFTYHAYLTFTCRVFHLFLPKCPLPLE